MKVHGFEYVYLDITHRDAGLPASSASRPSTSAASRFGIDLTREPIPVVPAAHYCCGGALTDASTARPTSAASTPPARWR